MNRYPFSTADESDLARGLDEVRQDVAEAIRRTSFDALIDEFPSLVGGGRMLRARLALRMGAANGLPRRRIIRTAAVAEMIHAARLLHADMSEGDATHRGLSPFQTEKGKSGAILLGDLLVCLASQRLLEQDADLIPVFLESVAEMCDAEVEQELGLSAAGPGWHTRLSLARRTTGALFAFVGHACGGSDASLCRAMREAGYATGTACHLADEAPDPMAHVRRLCETSCSLLVSWSHACEAWRAYLTCDCPPQLGRLLNGAVVAQDDGPLCPDIAVVA